MDEKVSEKKLLYDPLFDKKPDINLPDDPSKGLFGKTAFKKAVFIVVIVCFVSISIFISMYSVTSDTYEYEEIEGGGYLLSSFSGQEEDYLLSIDYVTDEDGNVDTSKPVTEVRQFAINCNEYLEYIYISDTVETINSEAFYTCTSLRAIIVDPDNEHYASVDGILYEKENGVITKLIQYPVENGLYRAALELNLTAPTSSEEIEEFKQLCDEEEDNIEQGNITDYSIIDTVTDIGELAFADCSDIEYVTFPEGIKTIETMAFFKCTSLKEINFPDGLEYIGSDAFNSCKAVTYLFIPKTVTEIGHHAFNQCEGVEQVYMEHESEDEIELGAQWAPRTRKVFMISVDVLYGQTREVM